MEKAIIGFISGLLVIISIIPYSIRTYQKKIKPNLTSWTLWTLIGLSVLLTYKSSGAQANIWPAVFGFTNPLIVVIFILRTHRNWEKLNRVEWICLIFGLLSLMVWFMVRESRELSQYALCLAILGDACAAVPTIVLVWKKPADDRPFAWTFFALGYGLAILAIDKYTFANLILPIYMLFGASNIVFPLAFYRFKNKIPLSEWI